MQWQIDYKTVMGHAYDYLECDRGELAYKAQRLIDTKHERGLASNIQRITVRQYDRRRRKVLKGTGITVPRIKLTYYKFRFPFI